MLSLPWPPIYYRDQNTGSTRNLPEETTEIKRSMSGLQTGPLKGCPHFHRNRYARVTCLGQPPNLASPSPRGRRTTSTTLSRPKSPIPPPKTIASAAAAAQPSTRRQPILRPPTPNPTSPPPALRCLFSCAQRARHRRRPHRQAQQLETEVVRGFSHGERGSAAEGGGVLLLPLRFR